MSETPVFFVPGASGPEQAERFREAIVRFARDDGFPASAGRIFALRHDVDGVRRRDEVGQLESQDGHEVVVAILEADKPYPSSPRLAASCAARPSRTTATR